MKRDTALWLAILTGPVIWAIAFVAKFFLSPWICTLHWKPAVHVISLLSLACTAGAGWLAWSQWRALGSEYAGDAAGAIPRARSMAFVALLVNAMFFLVLIASAVPEWMLEGCE